MLDIAAAFPDVTLIFDHGGIQAGWWERFYEECLTVIAANDNVYVETGLWWRELYEKPLMDPNIGPSKLLWGTDWGASMQIYSQLGRFPPSYAVQLRDEGIPHYQVDYWGWSLRELTSVRMSQDDMNLILGGNAARIFGSRRPASRGCSSRRRIRSGASAKASTGAARWPLLPVLRLLLWVAHAHEPDERDERAEEAEPGADQEGALVAGGERARVDARRRPRRRSCAGWRWWRAIGEPERAADLARGVDQARGQSGLRARDVRSPRRS